MCSLQNSVNIMMLSLMYRRRVCPYCGWRRGRRLRRGGSQRRRCKIRASAGLARTWLAWTYLAAGRDVEELGEKSSAARQVFGEDHDRDRDAWSRQR
jgi:hypothetical protein